MTKPWPMTNRPQGLLVDVHAEAPPVELDIIETPPQSPPTRISVIRPNTRDFGPTNAETNSDNAQVEQETRPATRPRLQRSHTQRPSYGDKIQTAIHDRSGSLSSAESFVPSYWEPEEVNTPPTPEDYVASPLDQYTVSPIVHSGYEVAESNYDPTVQWLGTQETRSVQVFDESLILEEAVERFLAAAYNEDINTHGGWSQHTVASSQKSQGSSIDPGILQQEVVQEEINLDSQESTYVHASPVALSFQDQTEIALPPQEYNYDEYLFPDFEIREFQFQQWDPFNQELESSQFFADLLFVERD